MMASFVSHSLPDIQENTPIVAVCGPTDDMDFASPEKDGWFFSDYFAFHTLLRGMGSSQTRIPKTFFKNMAIICMVTRSTRGKSF